MPVKVIQVWVCVKTGAPKWWISYWILVELQTNTNPYRVGHRCHSRKQPGPTKAAHICHSQAAFGKDKQVCYAHLGLSLFWAREMVGFPFAFPLRPCNKSTFKKTPTHFLRIPLPPDVVGRHVVPAFPSFKLPRIGSHWKTISP